MNEFVEHIVSCNGVKAGSGDDGVKYLELEYKDGCPNKNISINLNRFVTDNYHITDRLKDLLEIAGYIFSADRKTYRGNNRDQFYHSWSRAFHFHIGVSDKEFWERQEVKSILEEILLFLTGDHSYKFTFYEGEDRFPSNIFDNENFTINAPEKLKVSLFSGGLDSLAGAIELLETTDSELCLVSHQSGQPGVKQTHRLVFEALNLLYPNRCKHYKYHCGFDHFPSTDETQRTRSFLYTATAFTIAKTYNQNCIYVYENGITSINFAETQDLMNARASRTTHPKTLSLLEKLFSMIGETKFEIKNPFLFRTKTEVVEVLKKYDKLSLLDSSVSCSATRKHCSKFTHCGICSQCIDRRFAVYAAEMENADENGIYAFNFMTDDLEDDEIKKSLIEYIGLAQRFAETNINSFYLEWGSEIVEIEPYIDGENEEVRVTKIFDLCERHAKHVETALNRMREIHDSPYSKIRENSMFRMIIDQREYQKSKKKTEVIQKSTGDDELKRDNEMLTNELGNAHQIIKRYNKVKYAKIDYSRYPYNQVAAIADGTRKINKKLNFKKIAEKLGVTDKTAHNICNYHNIK